MNWAVVIVEFDNVQTSSKLLFIRKAGLVIENHSYDLHSSLRSGKSKRTEVICTEVNGYNRETILIPVLDSFST